MDATVRCRYSGTPFASIAASFAASAAAAAGPTPPSPAGPQPAPSAPAEPPARRKPSPHYKERPP
jgi:hypothetical protein